MTALGFIASASYMFWALSAIPSIRKRHLLLVLAGSYFASLYGGALIPYLYRTTYEHWHGRYLSSGRYFHSVFLVVFIYGLVLFKLLRWPVKRCLDHYAIAVMIMSAIGRIGCFLRGCCRGKPCDLPWAVTFPDAPGVHVHPAQLYMLGAELLILWTLLRLQKRPHEDGQTLWTAVCLYSIYRFWIETLRLNPVFVWGMTHAQLFSLLGVAVSGCVLLRRRRTRPAS